MKTLNINFIISLPNSYLNVPKTIGALKITKHIEVEINTIFYQNNDVVLKILSQQWQVLYLDHQLHNLIFAFVLY